LPHFGYPYPVSVPHHFLWDLFLPADQTNAGAIPDGRTSIQSYKPLPHRFSLHYYIPLRGQPYVLWDIHANNCHLPVTYWLPTLLRSDPEYHLSGCLPHRYADGYYRNCRIFPRDLQSLTYQDTPAA